MEDQSADTVVSPETITSVQTSCELDTTSTVSGNSTTPVKEMVRRRLSLREVWEIYIRLVKSQDQSAENVKRQSQLLDTLLHMCSASIQSGPLPAFSDMKSVCNQLCKEFMSDVLHITSRSDDDDVTELQRYLLLGRGGSLIKVIHSQPVQCISSRPALANLLGSMLPWCLSFPLRSQEDHSEDLTSRGVNIPPIQQCFPNVISCKNGNSGRKPGSFSQPVSNRQSLLQEVRRSLEVNNRKRFCKRRSSDDKDDCDGSGNESSDVAGGKTHGRSKKKTRSLHIRNGADKAEKIDTDSDDDDITDVLKSMNFDMRPMSGFELSSLVLDLLCRICLVDVVETGKSIAPSLLMRSLQCLKWDQDTMESLSNADLQIHTILNRQLLRVVFSLASAIAMQSNGVNILHGSHVIQSVVYFGKQTNFFKHLIKTGEVGDSSLQLHIDFPLLSDTMFGLIHLLTLIFDRLPFNPNFIKTASALIEDLDTHQGFKMISMCILHYDRLITQHLDSSLVCSNVDEDPVKLFSTFLSTIKIVRVTYQHSMKCVKRKHHKCSYNYQFDHHHDILGIQDVAKVDGSHLFADTAIGKEGQRTLKQASNGRGAQLTCIISYCTCFLLDLLLQVSSKGMRLDLIRAIYSSGICCCMDMSYIVHAFKEGVQKFSPAVRTYALDTLNKIVLEHFSGGLHDHRGEGQSMSCTYCDTYSTNLKGKTEKDLSSIKAKLGCKDTKCLDSGIDSSEQGREVKLTALMKISKWKPLRELGSLLFSSDEVMAASVAKHLMVLAIKGNGYLKAELFFSIYMQALEAVQSHKCHDKQETTARDSSKTIESQPSLSKSVQVHCLSALPYLLQANCVIQTFLTTKGVHKLCELLQDNVLRAPVLKIFDALVVLDDQKSGEKEKDCPCPYSGGLVIGSFINELCNRSFDSGDVYNDDSVRKRRVRRDSVVLSQFTLPVLVDLWEACANLCLHSIGFVSQFVEQQCCHKTEHLLLETVDILTSGGKSGLTFSQGETEDSGQEADCCLQGMGLDNEGSVLLEDIDQSDSSLFYMRVSLMESLIVVLGVCHKFTARKNGILCQTWNKFKERFVAPIAMEMPRLKVLLDAIMKSAMPEFMSVLEYSYSRNVAMVYIRDDDVYDEDEVRQLLQSGSDVEHESNPSLGYDADSEQSSLSDTEKDTTLRICLLKTRTTQKVFFPPTFGLLMEVLVAIHSNHGDGDVVVNSVLHKLLQKARVDEYMVQALCEQDVLSMILSEKGFWPCLINKDTDKGVLDNLLAMIELCGQHRLQSNDLGKMLQLFQLSDIAMDRLLTLFLIVVQNSQVTSHYSVTFPVDPVVPSERPVEDLSGTLTPTKPRSASPLLKSVTNITNMLPWGNSKSDLNTSNEPAACQQVWKLSALQISLGDSLKWPPFQHGFTLTTWLALNTDTETKPRPNVPLYDLDTGGKLDSQCSQTKDSLVSGCLHVVSIGTREKLFEVWVEAESGSIVIRLTSEMGTNGLVLRETKLQGIMSLARWQHLVISYVETLEGSTLTGKANLVVDGWQSHSFILDHPTSSTRYRHRSSSHLQPVLSLGHMTTFTSHDPPSGSWSLGRTMLYKGASISKEMTFHLFTLGPNQGSILKCDCGSEMNMYAPHLQKDAILHANIDHDMLVGVKKPDLTELRQSLLLAYDPKKCTMFAMFPKILPQHGSSSFNPEVLLSQQSRPVSALVQANLLTQENSSLEKAVYQSGGVTAILFLVAKVFERCPESMQHSEAEKVQAEALKVLMATLQHSSQLEEEYIASGGHALLCKVLTSCRSVVGPHVLKVLMDAATTDSLYKMMPDSGSLMLRPKSDALVRDVSIIEQLVLQWQVWVGQEEGLMDLLFTGLASLVREDHPHQAYNVKQYQVINIVNRIFKIYQERIQEGFPALPVSVSQSVVSIIQNLTGAPPDYHLILDICDFLLLVHPAANSYINHSRSSFYFSLPWGLPQSPLTRWKQGLGMPSTTSTPLKGTTTTPHESDTELLQKSKKSLFSSEEEYSCLPLLEIISQSNDVSSCNDPMQESHTTPPNKPNQPPTPGVAAESGVTQDAGVAVILSYVADTDSEAKDRTQVVNMDNTEVFEAGSSLGQGVETAGGLSVGLSMDGLSGLNERHRIPSGFESLYKDNYVDEGDERTMVTEGADMPEEDGESLSEWSHSDDSGPTSATRANLTLKFDEESMDNVKLEEGLTALCVGLLRLLKNIVVMMPDNLTEKTFQKSILNPEMFIVLAQNSSSQVREAVIKMIEVYLERANRQQIDAFLKIEGFQLLSAQLFLYPTHQEQLEAAITMVLHRPFYIDEGLHPEEVIEELGQVQQAAIPVMLALLGNCTGDIALCHNSLQFCCKLFDSSDMIATLMIEQAVTEVLCNMIMKLFDSGTRSMDVVGMDENEILLTDILEFLKVIAVREFSASGPQHYQQFEDIVYILQDMESRERELHGVEGRSCQTLRLFQQHILVAVTNMVEQASEEVSQQSFSIFSRPSHHKAPNTAYENTRPSSSPSLFAHRHPPFAQPPFSMSGHFGPILMHRKSPGGYFAPPDQPFTESLGRNYGGSGGDSDSSQESWHTSSAQTVNLPVTKHRSKSGDQGHVKLVRSNSILQTVLSIGKRKKLTTIPVSQNELIDRLKKFIVLAVDTAVFSDRKPTEIRKVAFLFESPSQTICMEREFMKKLFNFAYRAFEATLPHEKGLYKRTKNVIMWGAKDILRVQFGRLLTFMLSQQQDFDQRVYALSFIMGESRGLEVVKMVTTTSDLGNELAYNVRDLLVEMKKWLSRQQVEDGSRLLNHLSSAGFHVVPTHRDTATDKAELREQQMSFVDKHELQKNHWIKKRETALNRIFYQYNSLSSKLTDNAMEVTQSVTQLQTQERKKFITHIKQRKTESIQVKKQWQEIVQNLTHERAVWYDEKSYPQSWQLNPTEGPYRVRKRLQRGHLGILPRFLRREAQFKLATETVDPPLIYLFEDDHKISDSPALIYQLHKNKKIRYTFTCRAVSPNSESKGELLIAEDSVFFVADEAVTDANYTQVLLGNKDQLSMTWPFEDIQEVHKRWYELTDTGLEIFLTNGKTCLLALKSAKERDDLYQHLCKLELPNRVGTDILLDIVDRWQEGSITNFEYLTLLNKLAGRSFNDLMQYPIMPFILRDYTSDSIDLRDYSVYRDLAKPVSVQDPKNEQKFLLNYSILKQEYDKYDKNDITGLRVAPYHYGSHYSNSGSVLHFLVRLPPFTKMFLDFQDQNFDIPDRTFHNVHTSWRLSSAESNTDVKELIPEFFSMHEFLRNTEGFDLGMRQSGELVDHVLLPPWSQHNPRLFILIHRQALESEYVSENIGSWIDLMLGIKQRGELAVKAINVFHPATYFGLDVSSVKSEVDKKAIQTMVRTYGQTPKQLFRIKHPSKHADLLRHESGKLHPEHLQLRTVRGLKWGSYLGSPDRPDPVVGWESQYSSQVTQLKVVHNLVFGLGSASCLLLQQNQDKREMRDDTGSRLVWAAILTWDQTDGLLRVSHDYNKPPVNFICVSQPDEISSCVSVPDCRYLFIGGASGVITVYNTKFNPAKNSMLQVFGPRRSLFGHKAAVTSLCVCKPYSILVSGSRDHSCIIWDLNRVSYVRSILGYESSIQAVAISDTLGDIASVCHCGMGSSLYLHTVNAEFVTKITTSETINCLVYSTASEGVSINVIAGGLSSGVIRLWSSWDLTPVRDLRHTSMVSTPIISLAYTKDSQRLYSSSTDGRVVRWDYSGRTNARPNEFRPYLFPIV